MKHVDLFPHFSLFMTAFILCCATCKQPKASTYIAPTHQASVDWSGFYSALNQAERVNDSMYRECLKKLKQKPQIDRIDHPAIMRAIDY